MPLNIKVKRSVRTEIPLKIYGVRGEPLKFLIRSAPEHGKITEPRQVQKESAAVIYDPPEDIGITHDKFLYAVQSADGVSASVEVVITITDAAPLLARPGPVEFPKIVAGEESSKLIEVGNRGGGIATGELIVDGPWRIEGSTAYHIAAGGVASFKLVFAPKEGGEFDGSIVFTSDREHSTSLHGEALAPLTVSPEMISLESSPGDPVRTGSFDVANQTDQPRKIVIKSGAHIHAPDRVTVPPHETVSIPIQTTASDVALLNDEIQVESGAFSRKLFVKGSAVAPMMRFTSGDVNLGKQIAGHPAQATVEIENTGGVQGGVSLDIAPPFSVEPASSIIPAGGKLTVQIKLAAITPGPYRSWLKLTSGPQETEIGVRADVQPAPRRSPSDPAGSSDSERSPETLRAETFESLLNGDRLLPPSIPLDWGAAFANSGDVKILEITPRSATLSWQAKLSPATQFRVEMRRLGLDEARALTVTWVEHKPATVRREKESYVATLGGLQPAKIWAIRVLPLDASGAAGARLFALTFATPVAPPSALHISSVQWLLLALAACFAIAIWRYFHRPRFGLA